MYEQPTLTTLGEAENIILGFDGGGYDHDGLLFIPNQEFQSDIEE
jgi:hypothetical protein